jgi:hypothetical protein
MIEFNIESEDSSDHWRHLDPKGKNFLDLGCGRWCSREGSWDGLLHEEFSPIWIGENGANKVVGVDSSINEINYFNENNTDKDKFIFIHESINNEDQLKDLIKKYDINAIKCDIEGYEIHFLNFSKEDLKNINVFAVEYHSHDIKNKFTEKLNYWGFNIYAHGKLWIDGLGVLFAKK